MPPSRTSELCSTGKPMLDPRIATTLDFLFLCEIATGGNRSVDVDNVVRDIHPDGLHLLQFRMLHNDVETRTQWLVRLRDDIELREGVHEASGIRYTELWLDVPLETPLDKLRLASEF